MKFIFLTTQYNNATGGTKYDKMFIDRLRDCGENVKVIEDKDFSKSGGRHYYNSKYKSRINELANADFFITNSRLYTRFDGIIKMIRKANPKIRIIAFHHHFNFMTQKGLFYFVHKKLELSFLNSLDYVIYASGYVRDLSQKYVKTVGFLVETITPKASLRPTEKNGNNLLFIGNLEPRKGIGYLIDAFALMCSVKKDVLLTVVGGGREDYRRKLIRKTEKCGISDRIKFEGRISENDKIDLLNSADIFVFPSLLEGLGLVIREAMSYGLPVIAFDNSAMGYSIQSGTNGILVKNKNTKELYRAILLLISDESYREKLSVGALKSADNFGTIDSFYMNIDNAMDLLRGNIDDNHKDAL